MKKFMLSLIASLGVAVLLPIAAFAANITVISGIVTSESGKPIAGATVTVTCNGHTKTDTTDASGAYGVTFTDAECPSGKTVRVEANKDGSTGAKNGTVRSGHSNINLSVTNIRIIAAPEFGVMAATIATLVGGSAILLIRHRASTNGTV